jgi:hypothetical protein
MYVSSYYRLYFFTFLRMLTYADVCWRMLTYATYTDVCWRMLAYADVCCTTTIGFTYFSTITKGFSEWSFDVCSRMLTYAHVCSRVLTYAEVCSSMLTYADVCWRMLTYAVLLQAFRSGHFGCLLSSMRSTTSVQTCCLNPKSCCLNPLAIFFLSSMRSTTQSKP